MPRVQYKGSSHYREFTKADWTGVGVEDQNKVVFDRDSRGGDGAHSGASLSQVHELSEAAAKYLLENEPKGEFVIVENSAESTPPLVDEPASSGINAPTPGATIPPKSRPVGGST